MRKRKLSDKIIQSAEDRGERVREPSGQIVRVLELPVELPEDNVKRQQCEECIAVRGEADNIAEEFRTGELYTFFPDEVHDLYMRTSCSGLSRIYAALGRDCQIRRDQYSRDGRVVSELKY